MFSYHEVQPQDKDWIVPILFEQNRLSCEYAFANLFSWGKLYKTQVANYNNFVIARSENPKKENSMYSYLFHFGGEDKKEIINMMIQEAKKDGRGMFLYSLAKSNVEWLQNEFKDMFTFDSSRDNFDYIYSSENLRELKGKKFQKKRNHVSRFLRENPEYQVEKITQQNIQEIIDFDNYWANLYENADDKGIMKEHKAVNRALRHFSELDLSGCAIRVDNKIVAYSYGSPICKNVFCAHAEKALYDVNGAYNIINKEFANMYCKDYTYINREDDVGSEGLRTAKLSYNPEFLFEKYIAILKED